MIVSRYQSRLLVFALLLGSLAPLAACDNPNAAGFEAQLLTDTLALAVPDPAQPVDASVPGSALDVASGSFGEIVARRPERLSDAQLWDVALRRRGGDLVLVPPTVLRLGGSQARAAIFRVEGGFDDLRDASAQGTFTPDSVVVLRPATVYVLRSRDVPCSFGAGNHYAKLEALTINPVAGTAELRVVANRQCNDPRLAAD